jgi:hypothetical protein
MRRAAAIAHTGNEGGIVRTLVVSVLGLLPMTTVSAMMLMQILGVWK